MGFLTEVFNGAWPQILSNRDGKIISIWEDLKHGLLILAVLLLFRDNNIFDLLAGTDLLLALVGGNRVGGGNAAADETEEGEEGLTAHAGGLDLLLECLLCLLESVSGLLGLVELAGEVQKTLSQVLASLPVDLDWGRDESAPSINSATVPELLLKLGVGEELVRAELHGQGHGAWVTAIDDLSVNDLEVVDDDVAEGGEHLHVGWLDVLINLLWRLLKNKRPEILDLCDELGALLVDWLGEKVLLTDCIAVSFIPRYSNF